MTNSNENTMATMVGSISLEGADTITITPSTPTTPKQVKGGVFAAADIDLIKKALDHYTNLDIPDQEIRQAANLLHRLNSRI